MVKSQHTEHWQIFKVWLSINDSLSLNANFYVGSGFSCRTRVPERGWGDATLIKTHKKRRSKCSLVSAYIICKVIFTARRLLMSLCRRALSAAHLQQAKYSAELNRNRAAALFYKTNLDNKDVAGSELTETALFFFCSCPSYFVSDSPHRQRIQYWMSSRARAGIWSVSCCSTPSWFSHWKNM